MAAPVIVSPSSTTVAVNEPVVLDWTTDVHQSGYQVRVRTEGSPSWDVLDLPVMNSDATSHTVAADVLPVDDFEWQAGVVSPTVYPSATTYPDASLFPSYTTPPNTAWSSSAFFSGRLRPPAPTITAPADGETIDKSRYVMRWIPADLPGVPQAQTRFRVRRLDRLGVVREDSGEVVSTSAERVMNIDETDVWRVFDAQVFYDGLWSPVASREVYVFFVGPPYPAVALTASDATGSIALAITNPPPGAEQPEVVRNEVHRRVATDSGEGIRIAADVPPDGMFTDYTPASGQPYAYRVVAVGTDGNPTPTDWQE